MNISISEELPESQPAANSGRMVLTRKTREQIVIGRRGEITVTVLRIERDGEVIIGITAPPAVPVHRSEVAKRIEADGPRKARAMATPSATSTRPARRLRRMHI